MQTDGSEVEIMLIAIIGENCVGKSTLAEKINGELHAAVYSGKDYLRMEKSPATALETFKRLLAESVTGSNIIYVITEKEHLSLLPEGCFRIVLTSPLEVIKERFRQRMRGTLPPPVEKMLEAKHGMYDDIPCDMRLDASYSIEEVITKIKKH